MYIVLVYDVNIKRVNKVKKICLRYLSHIQNSVFEGYITVSKINRLKNDLKQIINAKEDSICIYKIPYIKFIKKEKIGYIKDIDNYI